MSLIALLVKGFFKKLWEQSLKFPNKKKPKSNAYMSDRPF